MLNFSNFMVYLKNLNSWINYTYKKAKVTRYDKGNLVQILIFVDANVVLNSKNEISPDVYYTDTNTHDYIPYDSVHPESCKKNLPYNLPKRIIVVVTDPEKVELRLNELRSWLKNNKYPDHIISNAFYNAKLQGPALKPKNNFNNIPFVTSFHEDADNKIIVKNITRKIGNTSFHYIERIF